VFLWYGRRVEMAKEGVERGEIGRRAMAKGGERRS